MISALRGAVKSIVVKALLTILALSFGLWGISDVFRAPRDDTIATVGDREISQAEFKRDFDTQLRFQQQQTGQAVTPDQARAAGFDRQVLAGLLRDAALEQQATQLGLDISQEAILDRLEESPLFKDSAGNFDADGLRRRIAQSGYTEQGFIEEQRLGLVRTAISSAVEAGLDVPDSLVEIAWRYGNEQRDVRFFVIPPAPDAAAPAESELRKFYDDNKNLFAEPERRSFAAIVVDPKTAGAKTTVTDTELEVAYEKRKADYVVPEQRLIQQIAFPSLEEAKKAHERITAGSDFFEIAKERGLTEQDTALGDISIVRKLDAKLADAASKLGEGEVSEPVEGTLATAILRVGKLTPSTQKPLADVRDDLIEKIRIEHGRDEVLTIYDRIEDARAGGATFEEIAQQTGLELQEFAPVGRDGLDAAGKPIDGFEFRDEIVAAVFASDAGVENDPLSAQGDTYVWYDVREIVPTTIKPYEATKDKVVAAYKAQKERQAVMDRAHALKERAERGESLDKLAQELGAEVKSHQGLKRNETSPAMSATAVAALFAAPENGFAVALEPDGASARLMQSSPVLGTPFDPQSQEAKAIRNILASGLANDLTAFYVTAVQQDLGVKVNETLWSRMSGGS